MHPAQTTCKEVRDNYAHRAEVRSRTWCSADVFRPSLQPTNSIKRRLEMTPTVAKQTGSDKTALRPGASAAGSSGGVGNAPPTKKLGPVISCTGWVCIGYGVGWTPRRKPHLEDHR